MPPHRSRSALVALMVTGLACARSLTLSDRNSWVTVTREQSQRNWGYNIFLDTLSARRTGAAAYEFWTIHEYDTALVDPSGARFLSEAIRYQVDCATESMKPLEVVRFDTTKARVVARNTHPQVPPDYAKTFQPPSGSTALGVLRGSCSILKHQPWEFDPSRR